MTTKTKTRTKAPLLEEPTPAPLVAPQTFEEWSRATLGAICKKDANQAARKEYRKLMELKPHIAHDYGDLQRCSGALRSTVSALIR